jgi:hypothetical protein
MPDSATEARLLEELLRLQRQFRTFRRLVYLAVLLPILAVVVGVALMLAAVNKTKHEVTDRIGGVGSALDQAKDKAGNLRFR